MGIAKEILQETLEKEFAGCELELVDMAGDQDHWQVSIKHESLSGKSRVDQHRAVMGAIAALNIHAVSIKIKN